MNLQLIVILLTGGLMYNTYHDNFLLNSFTQYKKYYKMGVIFVLGLGFYIMMSRNPSQGISMMSAIKQYINVMPIDKNSKDMIRPFLPSDPLSQSIQKIQTSGANTNSNGGRTSKRSVSETKKKFVAARQNWRCQKCKQQLTAWFEVDHTKRLDQGGSNEVDNLVALCRNCHGEKTSMENI